MALTVTERKRGSRSVEVQAGGEPQRDLTETWLVRSDDGSEDELDVYWAPGLPQINDLWTGRNGNQDPALRCVQKRVRDHEQTKKLWRVECKFSSKLPDNGSLPSRDGEPPEFWPPTIEWSTELEQVVVDRWRQSSLPVSGGWVLNSALDPLLDPVVDYYPVTVLRYSRYYQFFDSGVINRYVSRLNSDTFLGYPPGTAKMVDITSRATFVYGLQYWSVAFTFKFKGLPTGNEAPPYPTWRAYRADVGEHFLDGGVKKGASTISLRTVNLDGAGNRSTGAPATLWFDYHEFVPFSPLVFG